MEKKNKNADFDFVVLFAIIAGAAILVLAIYGATKFGETSGYKTATETAKEISILTNPLQAGFASGSFGKISFKQEARIENECHSGSFGGFGENLISVSTKSRNKWSQEGEQASVKNKYIFLSNYTGKEVYAISKPFELGFKVSDLTILISRKYCFVDSPREIEFELSNSKIPDIEVSETKENCSKDSIKVCFSSECDITVYGGCISSCISDFDNGFVEKGSERIFYAGNLLYAAIFSDKEIYDCNVKRLLYRAGKISGIYTEKAGLMNQRGCSTNIGSNLELFSAMLNENPDLMQINEFAKELDSRNKQGCELW